MPVVLLCHCDGTNGSTAFTDVSPSAHTLVRTASTAVSTAQVKFGTGSIGVTSSGAVQTTTGLSDFDFQSGPFTVEAWAYATSVPNIAGIVAQFSNTSGSGWLFGTVSGNLVFWYYDGAGAVQTFGSATAITTGAWHFYTADRDAGGTLRIYIDGVVVASTSAPTFQTASVVTNIGNTNRVTDAWPGYIDEVRVTKGTALYGGAFTPPSGPFTTAAFTTWSTTDKSASLTLTGSNLIATQSSTNGGVRGKDPKRTGKYYIEFTSTTTQSSISTVGIASAATLLYPGNNSCAVSQSTAISHAWDAFSNQAVNGQGASFTTGTVIGCAVDLDNALIWWRQSPAGNWNNLAANNPATGVGGLDMSASGVGRGIDAYPYACLVNLNNSITANFGATAFTGAVPAGFTSGWDDSVSIVTNMVATQTVMEQWGSGTPNMQATIVLIEHWASVADATPVTPSSDTRVMILA